MKNKMRIGIEIGENIPKDVGFGFSGNFLLLNHCMIQDRLLYYAYIWIRATVRETRLEKLLSN